MVEPPSAGCDIGPTSGVGVSASSGGMVGASSGGMVGASSGGGAVASSDGTDDSSPSDERVGPPLPGCTVGPPPDGKGEPPAAGGIGGGEPGNGGGTAPSASGGNPFRTHGQPRGSPEGCGLGPPPSGILSDAGANREETVTGITPCAKLAGSPGTDARTTKPVSPSRPASTTNLLPIAVAVAVSGSRLLRRVNEHSAPPSKYVLRSTRSVVPGATSTGGGFRTNCGDVGVESAVMSSPARSRHRARNRPYHSVARRARRPLHAPAPHLSSDTASWSGKATAKLPRHWAPSRSARWDPASWSPARHR